MAEVSRENRFCSVRVLRRHKTRRRGLSRNRRSRYRSTRRSRPRLKFGEWFESQSLFSPTKTVDSAIALSPATIDGRAMQRFVSPIQVYNGVHRPRTLFEGRTSNVKRVESTLRISALVSLRTGNTCEVYRRSMIVAKGLGGLE